jgi:hypothetical protein
MDLKNEAEFIVYQDEIQYRVDFGKVKSSTVSIAQQKTDTSDGSAGIIIPGFRVEYDPSTGLLDVPIAKRADASAGAQGIPGLMYPGVGLSYNEVTGELTRDFETSLTFVGLIGNDISEGQVTVPDISDQTGFFYIVGDPTYTTLGNDWGSASFKDVTVGDKVIRKYDGDWKILADLTGSMALLGIFSDTLALNIDETNPQFPILTIDNAIPASVFSFDDGNGNILVERRGLDGLMTDIDKAKLDNLGVLLDKTFVSEITTILPLKQIDTSIDGRLVKVELDINKATSTDVGVVKITEDSEIEKMIQYGVDNTSLKTMHMISTKQTGKYFLPSNFQYLEKVSTL